MTIYRGVGGINREIKQQFRGVGGVNREIKEQYRGAGGVNRKVFEYKPNSALYWLGDECITLSGGWSKSRDDGSGSFTKNTDNMSYAAGAGHAICIAATNLFNFTNYTTLYVELEGTITAESSSNFSVHISSNKILSSDTRYLRSEMAVSKTRQVINYDITNINASAYLVFGAYATASAKIYKAWVE